MTVAAGSRFKAVFFDIGNVLLHFNVRDIARKMAWTLGRHPLKLARFLWHSDIGKQVELGRLSGRQLYEMFREELGYDGDYGDFRRLWCDHFTLERRTHALLRRVAKRCRVYLLSNTNRLHYEHIRKRYAFTKHVSGAVLSYRVGLRKPQPGIFRAALRLARVRPGEAVFIDDLPANVEAARKLGITALRYTGPEKLRRDLLSLRVLE